MTRVKSYSQTQTCSSKTTSCVHFLKFIFSLHRQTLKVVSSTFKVPVDSRLYHKWVFNPQQKGKRGMRVSEGVTFLASCLLCGSLDVQCV